MPYLLTTDSQKQEMLKEIGVSSIADLLTQVPAELQMQRDLNLPPALTELELEAHVRKLAALNKCDRVSFLGGGAYDHFIPAAVDEITSRGELYTAYTPYQPEASQGSLQAFFEFQSLICELTGLDVANASLYEGGTAVSEAAFMAMRSTRRSRKVAIVQSVHPEYRHVLETYTHALPTEVVTIPIHNGTVDLAKAAELIDEETACVIFQQPNFFGCIEDVEAISKVAKAKGALSVVAFDPISLGILKQPGAYGVDIAVAEGQSLGTPLQYGGPYLGLMACKEEFVRKMPGRLITQAKDRDGNPCYVLGLQTREQHIRRDKATSNICTNQGLLALRATVYMSLLGPEGLKEVANLCCQKAHYAAEQLTQISGVELMFDAPFFKEFAIKVDDVDAFLNKAHAAGFDLGPELKRFVRCPAGAEQGILVAVTETRSKEQIDQLVNALK